MFSYLLNQLLYPKAVVLLSTSLLVLIWAGYFCTALAKRHGSLGLKHYLFYICYTLGVFIWALSNSYFHTDLIMKFGDAMAIKMAVVANLATLLAFVSAYCFIVKLHKHYTDKNVARWQSVLVTAIALFGVFSNLIPGGTVQGIEISGPSKFQLEFGPYTKYFFLGFTTLVFLTFFNLLSLRNNHNRIRQTRINYMILGITIFMCSTATIQVGMTFFFDNFSLTWLPPTLSLSEMLLMGYALLTSRFVSPRYICFVFVSAAITTLIYAVFISLVVPISKVDLFNVLLLVLLIGMTWHKLFKVIQKGVSLFCYGESINPVERIALLEEEFQISPTQAMEKLASYISVPKGKLRLLDDYREVNQYRSYFESYRTPLVIDEIEEELLQSSDMALSAVHNTMSKTQSALVLPLYERKNKLSHILVSSSKPTGRHFSYEELAAIERVLRKIQVHVNYKKEVRQSQALASSIAHEMRNPFSQLLLEFEMLEQAIDARQPSEQLVSYVKKGAHAIAQSHQLIDIIMRELEDASLDQEPVIPSLISSVICAAVDQYGFDNETTRQRIHLELDQDFVAEINATLLSFVLFNLLRNATYYFDSYPKSQITIRIENGQYENSVLFRDTGPGIPESLQARIFDDFFSYNKNGSSGLGLGYCQRVMNAFGGSIHCQSRIEQYSEFKLTFPATNISLSQIKAPKPHQGNTARQQIAPAVS
ncbi:hybrid sensor histidine kinase/response regulator [Vibrio bivalvicida]|uniref:histidine kinase n=2 Tax=Vibrio bivalvicida TaxID=1276888 RepID=A0A177Y3W1_9VIBR|nr:hybrid sensor histidine kinase/response regulator [Vibrio bivalvicida]